LLGALVLEWFFLATMDPGEAAEFLIHLSGPLTPRWHRTAIADEIIEFLAEPHPEPPVPMLLAAMRWLALLKLPRTGAELWAAPPLKLRRRDRAGAIDADRRLFVGTARP
jgi:hypothetical protein